MPHFFVSSDSINDDNIRLSCSDVNHVKNVLRKKPGDRLKLNDSAGNVYDCVIDQIMSDEIVLRIINKTASNSELSCRISLFQGLPKSDKLEFIIQKAVELGVSDIYPVINERSVVKLDGKKTAARLERWNKISKSAAEQSGRALIPLVHEPLDFFAALDIARREDMYIVLPYENADGICYSSECIGTAARADKCAVFIGPEGGFSPSEISRAKESDAHIITLGHRILRTETAGLFVLSLLSFENEVNGSKESEQE